jgi:acyl-CoA thioester hydrolase
LSTLSDKNAIEPSLGIKATTQKWFEYPLKVYPHHTDYGGVVWHGTYLTWLEEARVDYLRSIGVDFADLVKLGCDLPVVDLTVRYHQALRLGDEAILKARMEEINGVRLNWQYRLESPDQQHLYLSAQVTLVAIDREKGKILRQLPPSVQDMFLRLTGDQAT